VNKNVRNVYYIYDEYGSKFSTNHATTILFWCTLCMANNGVARITDLIETNELCYETLRHYTNTTTSCPEKKILQF